MSGGPFWLRAGATVVLAAGLVGVGRWTTPRSVAPAPVQTPAAKAVAAQAVAAQATGGPSAAWRLLFEREGDVWVAHGDGTGQRRLVANAAAPCWSPDRRRFAFVRAGQVWVADAAGQHERQLTAMPHRQAPEGGYDLDKQPLDLTWDQTDDVIYFSRPEAFEAKATAGAGQPHHGDRPRVGEIDAASILRVPVGAVRENSPEVCWSLLRGSNPEFADYSHPACSHDGRWLAYCCNGDIWCAERSAPFDGSEAPARAERRWSYWDWSSQRLAPVADIETANRGDRWVLLATHLAWSPDGRRLAYDKRRVGGSGYEEVHVLDLRLEHDRRLTVAADRTLSVWGTQPCFSPDGRWVAYAGSPAVSEDDPSYGKNEGIIATPVAGGSPRLIVRSGSRPAW